MAALDALKKAKDRVKAEGGDKPRPKVYDVDDDDAMLPKVLLYGSTGSGKTFFLNGPLLEGERVFVVSSDFGSNGLVTVRNELKRIGRSELLKNIKGIDLSEYEQIADFFVSPQDFYPEIGDFCPTVMMWEGFSTFNIDILDEYILSMAPGADGAGEMRKAGWTHTKQDWQGHKRGTLRALRKFMAMTLPDGTRTGKILSCLEDAKSDLNELTGKAERSVLVHGSGKNLMGPAFDVILECHKVEENGVIKYYYRCDGDSGKYLVKSRGYNLKPLEPADPQKIWKIIRSGVPAEPAKNI